MNIPTRKEALSRIFYAILYRLWLYRKRHYMITLIQIIMPPLIIFTFATIHGIVFTERRNITSVTIINQTFEKELYESICYPRCTEDTTYITYTKLPSEYPTKFIHILHDELHKNSPPNSKFSFIQVDSEDDIIKISILLHLFPKKGNYIGGIVMNKNTDCNNLQNVITCLNFKIRLAKEIPSEISASDFTNLDDSKVQEYYPLMGLQLAISKVFMKILNPNYTYMKINVQRFPYPPHEKFISVLQMTSNRLLLSISFVLGTTFIVYSAVKAPCTEKQSGFKVYLGLMGIPSWAFWIIWILNDLFIQFIAIGFQVILLFNDFNQDLGILVKHGNWIIWLLFLILYAFASVSFCIFLASFFSRGILATYTCAMIWLLSYYFADLYLPSYIVSFSRYSKLGMCLIPNAALLWGITLMTSLAGGINWENITHRLESTGISLGEVLIMLVVDIVFYFILTLYIDMLRPGQGPARSWYFFFKFLKKSNWTSFKKRRRKSVLEDGNFNTVNESGNFVNKFEAAIKFDNLSIYFHHNHALDEITMRIKEDKCTVMLGHNGAGKSSLLYLLCGGIFPTHGTAYVLGYSITKQMSIIQSFTSVCAENNFLCDDMTVLEHLLFIARLKGLNHYDAIKDARRYLSKLDLLEKCNRFPDYLLEFEKRKLSIIMAMMGKSQIILIDEPTRGIEEDMKRDVWDFILDFRNKTILVMTSSMDEAYALGSRIAILSHGKVVALGTPQHLENLFVTGYHLKIRIPHGLDTSKINDFVRTRVITSEFVATRYKRIINAMSIVDNDFDLASEKSESRIDAIEEFKSLTSITLDEKSNCSIKEEKNTSIGIEDVYNNLHEIEIVEDSETQVLSIQLPKSEVSLFSNLFHLLENPNILRYLEIIDWDLGLYAIESAFKDANVYREWVEVEPYEYRRSLEQADVLNTQPVPDVPDTQRHSPMFTTLNRFKALIIKRIMWIHGTWLYVLVQLLSPIFILIFTIQGTNSFFHNKLEKSVHDHSLNNFANPIILYKEIGNPSLTKYYKSLSSPTRFERIYGTFEERILQIPSDAEAKLSSTFVVGADLMNDSITAMFSPTAFHAGPISLNLVLNAYIKYAFPNNSYGIVSSSHPIQSEMKKLLKFYVPSDPDLETDEVLTFAIMLGFGFFIFTSGFVLQPVAERKCGLKKLQLNTTLSKFSYWASFLLCDLTLHAILIMLIIIVLRTLPDHNAFVDIEFAKHFVGVYLLAGYGAIIQSYVASFALRQVKTCFYGMLSYNQVLGMFTFILGQCISGISGEILRITFKIFLFPYSVPSGLFSLISMASVNTQCNLLSKIVKDAICEDDVYGFGNQTLGFDRSNLNKTCCDAHCLAARHCKNTKMYFKIVSLDKGLLSDVFFLGLHGVVMTILLVLVELGIAQRFFRPRPMKSLDFFSSKVLNSTKTELHESIKQEHEKLSTIKQLAVDQQEKFFLIDSISLKIHSHPVLNNILLVAQPGEILAIVGPHNSGKTVLMKILARFISAKKGNVFYKGESLFNKNSNKFIEKIGYCPAQITQMYSKISGIQLMRLFGRLRGIPESKLESHVTKWLNLLGLTKRASGHFQFYTDSMKRKLLLALALIGDPPVLLLDDPTENLDPLSKLQFWCVLKSISASNTERIIIFTTRRTEDLENNVGRMAVLVNGCIECIMSPADMMTQFGQGFTISILLKHNPVNAGFDEYVNLKNAIKNDLRGVILQEEQYTLKYKVPKGEFKWSELFEITEKIKLSFENIIEDYTIRETDLEDVYQALAKKQQHFVQTKTTWDEFCLQYC